MFFGSRLQSCLILFAIIALPATATSETGASKTDIETSAAGGTAESAAAKAVQLLASMPACGVCRNELLKMYGIC
jgi:hypothetical protein